MKAVASRKDRWMLGRDRAARLQTELWAARKPQKLLGQAGRLQSGRTWLPKSESPGMTRNSSVQYQALEIVAAIADQKSFTCIQHKRQCWLDARILCRLIIIFCQGACTKKKKKKERRVFLCLFCSAWKLNGMMAAASTYLRITKSCLVHKV